MSSFQNRQLGIAEQVNETFDRINENNDEVEVDLNDLQDQINVLVLGASNETIGVFSESDAVNTNNYAVTTGVAAYFIGWKINLTVVNNNTGNATLNPDGLGAQSIKVEQIDGTFRECQVDEISGTVQVEWDGTQWKLISAKSFDDYNRPVMGGGFLINGDFGVNQLVVSGTVVLASGEYGHGRFKGGASGCTYTFSETGGITTITITAGSLIQTIESVNLVQGTYVLSWEGTAQGKIGPGSYGSSGISSAITGVFDLDIEFNTGTLKNSKFEIGIIPTSFIPKLSTDELRDCERYLIDLEGSYTIAYITTDTINFALSRGLLNFMRVNPSFVNNAIETTDWNVFTGSGVPVTGFTLAFANDKEIVATKISHGVTDGFLRIINKGKIFADAEL